MAEIAKETNVSVQPRIILFQFFIAHPLDLLFLLSRELLPHRLVHLDHIQGLDVVEHLLAVRAVNQRPTILLRILSERLLLNIFEGPVLAHGHRQIRNQQALPNIPLDGLCLDIQLMDGVLEDIQDVLSPS